MGTARRGRWVLAEESRSEPAAGGRRGGVIDLLPPRVGWEDLAGSGRASSGASGTEKPAFGLAGRLGSYRPVWAIRQVIQHSGFRTLFSEYRRVASEEELIAR